MAALVSGAALMVVCVVNFLRAAFTAAEYEPAGPVHEVSRLLLCLSQMLGC